MIGKLINEVFGLYHEPKLIHGGQLFFVVQTKKKEGGWRVCSTEKFTNMERAADTMKDFRVSMPDKTFRIKRLIKIETIMPD